MPTSKILFCLNTTQNVYMKDITYVEMEQAINKPYITYKEVMILAMCGENRARELMKDLIKKQGYVHKTKPMLVNTELVLESLNLSASKIHKEAERIRKSGISPLNPYVLKEKT